MFPAAWKKARVTLLYKGTPKPVDCPSSFRPLSLLDWVGKLYECLLLNRLAPWVTCSLSPNQYGFRHGTGTADAIKAIMAIADDAAKGVVKNRHLCVLVTLDIKNAFN